MTERSPEGAPPQIDADQLALDRTRLAYERTLLAWVRTATGLITFGFSIYKYFQFQQPPGGAVPHHHLVGPRGFAILTIGLGLTALVLATLEHRANMRTLRAQGSATRTSLAGIFAALLSLLGLLGLCEALFRE
jgi:putative membrane protein